MTDSSWGRHGCLARLGEAVVHWRATAPGLCPLARQPSIVVLDEATSALDSANETALYERLRASGTTLISIAHRPAVLKHHTHVLEFKGEGAWELHAAADFRFDR